MLALQKAGISVERYFASEIDKYAIAVSQANWFDIEHIGSVVDVEVKKLPVNIDLVIGGSPCQGFSFAGKQLNFEDPRSKLFFEFVRVLEEARQFNPRVKFLLENVKMKKEYQDVISGYLGVEPIEINSALVSAQNRKRLYWTNIEGISQPEDKGILLKNIVHEHCDNQVFSLPDFNINPSGKGMNGVVQSAGNPKSKCPTTNKGEGQKIAIVDSLKDLSFIEKQNFTPSETEGAITLNPKKLDGSQTYQQDRIYSDEGKMVNLSAELGRFLVFVRKADFLNIPEATKKGSTEIQLGGCADLTFLNSRTRRGRAMLDKSNCLTAQASEFYTLLDLNEYLVPFDKTLQIIEKEVQRGKVGFFRKDSQANRVYFIHDKAVTLCGDAGGGAAKMGQYLFGCITPDRIEKRQNGQRFSGGKKFYTLTAQDKHGILIEGYIRKLTPIECERLQTIPDNYTNHVSNSQRYKMLGNGWTVDVIAHIFKNL